MRPQVQLLIGFALFVITNASGQGLIPDTVTGKWVLVISSCLTLYMQKLGLGTEPDRKPDPDKKDDEQPPPGGNDKG
jgi:hypothetical protein